MTKVLYIEHDDDNLYMLKMRLERIGDFEVLASNDSEQGCKLALTERPDVILMDLEMRRIDRRVADRHQCQRVAVRSRSRDCRHRDITLRSCPVLDHDGLPPVLGQFVADDPRQRIRSAARREADDDPDRLCRIVGCTRWQHCEGDAWHGNKQRRFQRRHVRCHRFY